MKYRIEFAVYKQGNAGTKKELFRTNSVTIRDNDDDIPVVVGTYKLLCKRFPASQGHCIFAYVTPEPGPVYTASPAELKHFLESGRS